jgi:uncharacterized repeat protein (TIGR01451 family)
MPSPARRTRVILGLVAFAAALAAWQGAALGIDVTSAKLDVTSNGDTAPATSVSSPAGGVIRADLSTKNGGWRSTRYTIRPDSGGAGTSECRDDGGDFNITAPAAPGKYDIDFTVYEGSDCRGDSDTITLDKGLEVTAPRANPNLPARCGIDVQLILDRSGSIGSTSGATQAVRSAAKAFVNALSGTGSQVAVIDFSTTAKLQIDYAAVTPEWIATTFNPYIDNKRPDGYDPSGWTNWEDAFRVSKQTNANGVVADLVVFITDGDPTARLRSNGQAVTDLTEGEALALTKAQTEADFVKAQGQQKSHVFALGVGSAVTKPTSARRLTAVSGTQQYPGTDFPKADYTLVEDFDDLAQALRDIAIEMCEASVTITKLVDEGDGQFRKAPGWQFTAEVTVPGGYKWVVPPPPTPQNPRTQTTNKDGVATFQWKPNSATANSTVSIAETVVPGYEFVDYECKTSSGGIRKRTRRGVIPGSAATGTIRPNEYATCTVRNRKMPPELGSITIVKESVPQDPKVFNFTGTAPIGEFALSDDGKPSPPTQRTFDSLPAGTYVVSEAQQNPNVRLAPAAKWTLTDLSCNKSSSVVVNGPEVTINLREGEAVTCVFQNTRGDEPDPPDPPVPPDPPKPPPPAPPTPPTPTPAPAPTTQLEVEKTAPATARVGQRVPFSLTVTNVGPIAAENVHLRDLPPGAIVLTDLRTSRKPYQAGGGKATWSLGALQPGGSRTISGSVVIRSGTPGNKHNTALASADNAKTVHAYADTRLRVLAQVRVIPPVTG